MKKQGVVDTARNAGLDAVGLAAGGGGAALGAIGHGIAGAALSVADVVTLGQIDSIGDAKDEHFEEMNDGMGDAKAGMVCFTANTDYYRSKPPADDKTDWMAKIPDEVNVTQLFLPGTHDTVALSGGSLAQCQSWTLAEQLNAGLRAFDIRAKHEEDALPIYHGIIRMETDFDAAVDDMENFLEQHPTELILVRIKREGESGEHHSDFNEAILSKFKHSEYWHTKCPEWKSLGEMRGKIVPVAIGSAMKLYRHALDVQDVYDIGDENKKFDEIKTHAMKDRTPGTLFVSFCSAVGREGNTCFKAPCVLAYDVNKMVMDAMPGGEFGAGVYLFDFPGNALVDAVIARNPTG